MSNNTIEDGGPAFPVQELNADGSPATLSLGLSIRDHFAGLAMQAFLSNPHPDFTNYSHLAWGDRAYQVADAMLSARKGGSL